MAEPLTNAILPEEHGTAVIELDRCCYDTK
jgi:hypothetical protein